MKRFLGGILAAALALAAAAPAGARDVTVRSFDGTEIVAHFFPAKDTHGQRAPTVLIGHGWGGSGDTNSESVGGPTSPGRLRSEGYNVLTWDARGFGRSGGTVQIDSKDFEGRDVQALLDFVAEQPEAQLDAPGDPRVGMGGGSYGGAIQLVTAAIDRRVDAIVPQIAWNDLVRSLYQNDTVKTGWGTLLTAAGATSVPGEGSLDPHIVAAAAEGVATGRFSDENVRWFGERSTAPLVPRIQAPTLILQGTVDTLFTLRESIDNHALLKGTGVPLKLIWFCGGHGTCLGRSDGQGDHILKAVLAWYARYLKGDSSVDTGPAFEWLTDTDAQWHAAEVFPPVGTGTLRASGSGSLALSVGATSGQLIAATPSGAGLDVEIPPPAQAVDVLGEPRLKLTYSGVAAPADVRVYAQLVDAAAGRVVGNQVTPLPLTLDGQPHTAEFGLEPVAARFEPSSSWKLQFVAGSTVYDIQRAAGSVDVQSAELELPVIDAAASRASLRLGRPYALRRASRRRPAHVRVRAVLEGFMDARVRLLRRKAGRWVRIGRSREFAVGTSTKRVRIRVRRALPRGRYRAVVSATDQYGRHMLASRRARLR